MAKNNAPTLNIGALSLNVQNAMGHEHRLEPIAQRAASLFAAQLQMRTTGTAIATRIDSLVASPLNFNLRSMSNEQAATAIASAWLDAVALRLKF